MVQNGTDAIRWFGFVLVFPGAKLKEPGEGEVGLVSSTTMGPNNIQTVSDGKPTGSLRADGLDPRPQYPRGAPAEVPKMATDRMWILLNKKHTKVPGFLRSILHKKLEPFPEDCTGTS